MGRQDDIKKELKKQEDEVYCESTMSGSSPDPESDDNVATSLKRAVGGDINPGSEFHLADEVLKDENDRRGPAYQGNEEEEEEESI